LAVLSTGAGKDFPRKSDFVPGRRETATDQKTMPKRPLVSNQATKTFILKNGS
jgi:hypothetical protein